MTLAICGLAGGCTKTFEARVRQPNPLAQPHETLQESEELVIVTGDMQLRQARVSHVPGGVIVNEEPVPLRNRARFSVVSRDRLRFHVQLEHKFEDYADVTEWEAELIDDRGRRYAPASVERVSSKHLTQVFDSQKRSVVRDRYGDVVQVNNDAHLRRQQLVTLLIYRGKADLVFYSRDIFTPDVRSLKLVLRRATTEFEFAWDFTDGLGDAPVATSAAESPGDFARQ